MLTIGTNRGMGAGTPPYMSPEMFKVRTAPRRPTPLQGPAAAPLPQARAVPRWAGRVAGRATHARPVELRPVEPRVTPPPLRRGGARRVSARGPTARHMLLFTKNIIYLNIY